MYHFDTPHDRIERDPRNDHRRSEEVVVDRKPIVADAPRDQESARAPGDRRRGERRRIERMGTDI